MFLMSNVGKLIKLFESELSSTLRDQLVYTGKETDSYILYGKFYLQKQKDHCIVTSSVTKEVNHFSSLRMAAAWCTLYHNKRFFEAKRISVIDLKLASLSLDIEVYRNILKNRSKTATLYKIKLQEDSFKRKRLLNELEDLVMSSANLQSSKFTSSVINNNITWKKNL